MRISTLPEGVSQLELKLFMSRARYSHIAVTHIALFRLSLLTECNILALAQDVALQTIHIR
jgi:hypothetical protein